MRSGDASFDTAYHRGVAGYRARCHEERTQNDDPTKVAPMATCAHCLISMTVDAQSCAQCGLSDFQFFLTSSEGELCSPTLRLRRGNKGMGK